MSRKNETGSATTFVVIAIILVALAIGAITFVVKRGEQVRRDEASSKLAQEEAEQKAKDDAEAAKYPEEASKPANTNIAAQTPSATANTQLPDTGFEIDILQILAIGLLTYGFMSFVMSRNGLKRSL